MGLHRVTYILGFGYTILHDASQARVTWNYTVCRLHKVTLGYTKVTLGYIIHEATCMELRLYI